VLPNKGSKKRIDGTFLHFDSAHPDQAGDDFDHIRNTKSFQRPDDPDLAQWDSWLFKNMKTKLEGNAFISTIGTIPKINKNFEGVTQSWSKSRADK
jgi:hypothetical protein